MANRNEIPDSIRRVFAESFAARDIAEPLPSFDANHSGAGAWPFLEDQRCPVVGVRRGGIVVGYVELSALPRGVLGDALRPFEPERVVRDAVPLLEVVLRLGREPYLFVPFLGSIQAVITRGDLEKAPARMWLFAMVTMIEMRYSQWIEEICPGESWRSLLSPGRLEKAEALLAERRRRRQELRLADCLQFADKGRIVARHEGLRRRTIFSTRRQAEEAVKRLELLRNDLAHGQELVAGNWEAIHQLAQACRDGLRDGEELPSQPTAESARPG